MQYVGEGEKMLTEEWQKKATNINSFPKSMLIAHRLLSTLQTLPLNNHTVIGEIMLKTYCGWLNACLDK
jgi:hypothetical protein